MRVINRTAVTLVGAQPYIDWTLNTDADFAKGAVTVARAKTYGTAYLLPEFELEEDLQEWVRRTPRGFSSSSLPRGRMMDPRGRPRAT